MAARYVPRLVTVITNNSLRADMAIPRPAIFPAASLLRDRLSRHRWRIVVWISARSKVGSRYVHLTLYFCISPAETLACLDEDVLQVLVLRDKKSPAVVYRQISVGAFWLGRNAETMDDDNSVKKGSFRSPSHHLIYRRQWWFNY